MKHIGAVLPEGSEAENNKPQEVVQAVSSCISSSTEIVHQPALRYYVIKRFLDIVLSAIGLVLLSPMFLIIAICIKLDDGGDILHFREIIGLHGRRFYALKFRTMIPDADTYLAKHPDLLRKYEQNMKLAGDPRITRVGKILR